MATSPRSSESGIVLGLGGTVDYEIAWDSKTFAALVRRHAIGPDEVGQPERIASERDLVRSILAYVTLGVGGERYVENTEVIRDFASHFAVRSTLGGTCVRAALSMARLGIASTVHLVSIDDTVRDLLPASIGYLCSATEDTLDPHLIVQYPAGAGIETEQLSLTAARENRLIYVHDVPNLRMRLAPELDEALASARLLLVSGFNSMQDESELRDRLDALGRGIAAMPSSAVVFYEDAGFHVPAFSEIVARAIAPKVDIFSMNEDEAQSHLGRDIDLLSPRDVARALRDLHADLRAPAVVVHTRHWAAAVGESPEDHRAGLRGGIVMASTRYAVGDGMTVEDYAAMDRRPRSDRAERFRAELESFMGADVACEASFDLDVLAPTTIGLGDSFVGGFLAAVASSQTAPRHS